MRNNTPIHTCCVHALHVHTMWQACIHPHARCMVKHPIVIMSNCITGEGNPKTWVLFQKIALYFCGFCFFFYVCFHVFCGFFCVCFRVFALMYVCTCVCLPYMHHTTLCPQHNTPLCSQHTMLNTLSVLTTWCRHCPPSWSPQGRGGGIVDWEETISGGGT